jgi:hypothetical protein
MTAGGALLGYGARRRARALRGERAIVLIHKRLSENVEKHARKQ